MSPLLLKEVNFSLDHSALLSQHRHLVKGHQMLHKPIKGVRMVAVKIYAEIVASVLLYIHSTCALILTISRVCLEVTVDLFFSLPWFFSGIKNEPEVSLIAK